MGKIIRISTLVAALATFSLMGSVANAGTTNCPNSGSPDTTLALTMDVGSSTCVAYEGNPDLANGTNLEQWVASTYNTGLVAKSDGSGAAYFNVQSGSATGGLTGSFTTDGSPEYLLFKTGEGQNDPSWFLFRITGATAATLYSWVISGTVGNNNALSHVSAFVPIPAAAWLMGSGLVALFGIGRRRKASAVAA